MARKKAALMAEQLPIPGLGDISEILSPVPLAQGTTLEDLFGQYQSSFPSVDDVQMLNRPRIGNIGGEIIDEAKVFIGIKHI